MPEEHANTSGQSRGFATVDLSNILTAGQCLAAVRRKFAQNMRQAQCYRIFDRSWRIDAKRLYEFIAGDRPLKHALVVGSRRPDQPAHFDAPFKAAGFRTDFRARSTFGREKGVDCSVISAVFEICAHGNPEIDEITHVGGDADHVPLVESLAQRGFAVDVVGFRHATSRHLIAAARRFIALDDFFELIGFFKNEGTSNHHHAITHQRLAA